MLVVYHLVEPFGPPGVGFDDLGAHVVGHGVHEVDGGAAPAHDKHVLHVGVVLLSGQVADVVDVFGCRHEVDDVAVVQAVAAVGDYGLVVALHGYDVVG